MSLSEGTSRWDFHIIIPVLTLFCLGLVMVSSA